LFLPQLNGRLGIGNISSNSSIPIQVFDTNIDNVDICSGSHTLILKSNSSVVGFGENQDGQLGNGGTFPNYVPQSMMIGSNISSIYCGNSFSLMLSDNFRCFSFSPSNPKVCSGKGSCIAHNTCVCQSKYFGTQCEISRIIIPVTMAFGTLFSVVIFNDGTVRSSGSNSVMKSFFHHSTERCAII
jgi:hypothetical protein